MKLVDLVLGRLQGKDCYHTMTRKGTRCKVIAGALNSRDELEKLNVKHARSNFTLKFLSSMKGCEIIP